MSSIEGLVQQIEKLTTLTQAQGRVIDDKDAALAKALRDNLALHRKLAGETLRADQGWARYEQANNSRMALEMGKATPQQHAQAAQPSPANKIAVELPMLPRPTNIPGSGDWFREMQMRTYGNQCRAAALEEAAKRLHSLADDSVTVEARYYFSEAAKVVSALNKTEK